VARDITERLMMDRVIKQSEERFRSVVENSHDAIVIIDRSHQMVYANDQLCHLLGEPRQKLLGRDFRDYVDPSDVMRVMDIYRQRREGGSPPGRYEFRLIRKDGEELWVETSSSLISDSQGLVQSVAQLLDITGRKRAEREKARLEAQLRQAQKMEGIGTLASGVAHDFNNILQVISGYVQFMRGESGRPPEDAARLDQIHKAVARASDLVNRLLAFGRKVEPQMGSLDLNEEIQQVVALLERTLPKMINIQLELGPDVGSVRGDASLLGQVIVNLSSNAADAMPEGGRLVIKTSRERLEKGRTPSRLDLPPGEYAMLSLSDNGQGIPDEYLDHIFDPFFTTKEVGRGTGLGLSMAYGIVLSHNGRIFCDSKMGQGTTFTIYLPVRDTEQQDDLSTSPQQITTQKGTETVLLVDDEPSLVTVGSEILSSLGYHPIGASSGEEALEIYREQREEIALVVLDLGMPGMGGRKCLKQLREIDPTAKVIVASGYAEEGLYENLKQAGAARFLRKPYQLADLVRNIREVLDE
jgi:PAS domain S-box-containing protein